MCVLYDIHAVYMYFVHVHVDVVMYNVIHCTTVQVYMYFSSQSIPAIPVVLR